MIRLVTLLAASTRSLLAAAVDSDRVGETSLAAGLLPALAALGGGLEVADSLVMGLTLVLTGLVSGGAGLILAALAPSARAARGSGCLLAVETFRRPKEYSPDQC